MKIIGISSGLLAMLLLVGCSGPRTYIHPQADISYVKMVAVVPFTSSARDRQAGSKITELVINELLMAGKFDVVEPGEVKKAMQEMGLYKRGNGVDIDNASLKKLGEALKAQAVIIGDVREYDMIRAGQDSYPVVSVTLRLVDTDSGRIAGMVSHTGKGGPGPLFFSFGETHTLSQMAEKVCSQMVGSLIGKAY